MDVVTVPIIVGCFGKVFGVKGWIKIVSFTSPSENILKFKPWIIGNGFSWKELFIEDNRKHFSSIIVKISSCNSPEDVRCFTNLKIGIWRKQLPLLKNGEYYWADLIGLSVISSSNNVNLGIVKSLIATGANDVLVVIGERRKLIPYISQVILNVDLSNKIIYVNWDEQ
jgi:16S rRNA processing protein RimM